MLPVVSTNAVEGCQQQATACRRGHSGPSCTVYKLLGEANTVLFKRFTVTCSKLLPFLPTDHFNALTTKPPQQRIRPEREPPHPTASLCDRQRICVLNTNSKSGTKRLEKKKQLLALMANLNAIFWEE
jgi:hypothetical protein